MKRNLLATLMLSQGVPMLLAGDEIGRTQGGTTTPTARTTRSSWVDWDLSPEDRQLYHFTAQAIERLRANPVLRRRRFFTGAAHPRPAPRTCRGSEPTARR